MNISELNPNDINPIQLSLISFGSLGGIGVGLLFSFILTSNLSRILTSIFFLCLSLWLVIKNIHLLTYKNI